MSKRSTYHDSFVIERTYAATRARVFKAWADPASKARWFACHDDWGLAEYALDFRVGGRERLKTGPKSGPVHAFDGEYLDIVPDERIIYAYTMHLDDRRISASLATVELKSAGSRTILLFTEQAIFLDGYDGAEDRRHGTRAGLDSLEAELMRGAG